MSINIGRSVTAVAAGILPFACTHAASVTVKWEHTDKYSDLGSAFSDDVSVKQFAREVEPYVQRMAKQYLPEDTKLTLTITDVDLAGDHEPWRVDYNVRIVRNIYPPRMAFNYTLEDGDGEIVKSGNAKIADTDFDYNVGPRFSEDDQFFYEKEMLGEWIRDTLARD